MKIYGRSMTCTERKVCLTTSSRAEEGDMKAGSSIKRNLVGF